MQALKYCFVCDFKAIAPDPLPMQTKQPAPTQFEADSVRSATTSIDKQRLLMKRSSKGTANERHKNIVLMIFLLREQPQYAAPLLHVMKYKLSLMPSSSNRRLKTKI